jgi:hypothetical protein
MEATWTKKNDFAGIGSEDFLPAAACEADEPSRRHR